MNMPGFTAETALNWTHGQYKLEAQYADSIGGEAVVPQQRYTSPCFRLGGGRFCVRLPIIGRRCVNIPQSGRWRVRCRLRFRLTGPRIRCRPIRC